MQTRRESLRGVDRGGTAPRRGRSATTTIPSVAPQQPHLAERGRDEESRSRRGGRARHAAGVVLLGVLVAGGGGLGLLVDSLGLLDGGSGHGGRSRRFLRRGGRGLLRGGLRGGGLRCGGLLCGGLIG